MPAADTNNTFAGHPCFAVGARTQAGRIHLPVAAKSTIRRRFGEPETPGRALSPKDVTQWLDRVLAGGTHISMVGITGPGEPLAEPGPVFETLRAVREQHPDLALTLSTNGLLAAQHADALAGLGLSHVTVLVDAVDPLIVEQLYAWIRPGKRTLPLPEAARLLVDEQARTIRAFREAGLFVKVNMTVIAGINEEHVTDVASITATLGADMLALVPFQPACPDSCCDPTKSELAGSEPGAPKAPDDARMEELRELAGRYIPLMPGFDSCGQNIVGLEQALPEVCLESALPKPSGARVNVAVASASGLDVDLHLGQAIRFLIFGPRESDGLPCLLDSRDAPQPTADSTGNTASGDKTGGANARWAALAETLHDCFAILAASAGAPPREFLATRGITVLTGETQIQGAVDTLYGGGKKGCKKRIKAN
ncbi:MAG: radical SAM protein [Humidesulfovibrio sp.]|nr:radical SAM protein [Humidesulfovibrio sp.]